MNYVILDLEWDSAYFVKEHRFINQIIQIGAVKLDDNLEIVDSFQKIVKSSISKRLTTRFVELTGITKEMMQKGLPLFDAIKQFNDWAGEDKIILTWSNSDLFVIYENTRCLLDDSIQFNIGPYVDLQKYVQNILKSKGHEINSQISLSNASQMLSISYEGLDLHTAKDDSLLAAQLLKSTYDEQLFNSYVRDASTKEFYKRLTYKPHHLTSIKDSEIKKDDLMFACDVCGVDAKRITSWKYKNRWFIATFYCRKCKKRFVGRVSFKKNYDNVQVKKRVTEYKKVENNANKVQQLPETV
jgi:DNA polymerase III alpha subunit (gram-positive type)